MEPDATARPRPARPERPPGERDERTERHAPLDPQDLARRFEALRPRLRAVAYRMLGSLAEADEAVQDTWLRLGQSSADEVENLAAWLTTVVSRICLNILRGRTVRKEDAVGVRVPDPILHRATPRAPDAELVLADSVGLALLVLLDTLEPAERLAFVLHDLFELPFDDIAAMLGRTPAAARQLASRARRRVRGAPVPDPDLDRQRGVVEAFFAAARGGRLDELIAVLDPDVVLRSDGGARRPEASALVRGAAAVASRSIRFAMPQAQLRPALVNGAAAVVVTLADRVVSVMAFTVTRGVVACIDVIADPDRLERLDLTVLDG